MYQPTTSITTSESEQAYEKITAIVEHVTKFTIKNVSDTTKVVTSSFLENAVRNQACKAEFDTSQIQECNVTSRKNATRNLNIGRRLQSYFDTTPSETKGFCDCFQQEDDTLVKVNIKYQFVKNTELSSSIRDIRQNLDNMILDIPNVQFKPCKRCFGYTATSTFISRPSLAYNPPPSPSGNLSIITSYMMTLTLALTFIMYTSYHNKKTKGPNNNVNADIPRGTNIKNHEISQKNDQNKSNVYSFNYIQNMSMSKKNITKTHPFMTYISSHVPKNVFHTHKKDDKTKFPENNLPVSRRITGQSQYSSDYTKTS